MKIVKFDVITDKAAVANDSQSLPSVILNTVTERDETRR